MSTALLLFGCASGGDPTPQPECLSGDCDAGIGTLQYPDGHRYHGEFRDGRLHGEGLLDASNFLYKGDFSDAQFVGTGALTRSNGDLMRGEFHDGHLQQGVIEFADGTLLRGQFKVQLGRARAHGLLEAEGITSEGTFDLNSTATPWGVILSGPAVPNGTHRQVSEDGTVETIRYAQGVPQGRGTRIDPDGNDWLLVWQNGDLLYQAPGPSTLSWHEDHNECQLEHDDWVFLGHDCADGMAQGQGLAVRRDSERQFEGEFRNGQFVEGAMTTLDNELFVGHWQDFRLHGQGQHWRHNELVFDGEYQRGTRHGQGFCLENETLMPCEYYENHRMDEAHVLTAARTKAQEQSRQRHTTSRRAISAMDELTRDHDRSWEQRQWSLQRDIDTRRQRQATNRAIQQGVQQALTQQQAEQQRTQAFIRATNAEQERAQQRRQAELERQQREQQRREAQARGVAQERQRQARSQIAATQRQTTPASSSPRESAPDRANAPARQSPVWTAAAGTHQPNYSAHIAHYRLLNGTETHDGNGNGRIQMEITAEFNFRTAFTENLVDSQIEAATGNLASSIASELDKQLQTHSVRVDRSSMVLKQTQTERRPASRFSQGDETPRYDIQGSTAEFTLEANWRSNP